MHVGKRVGRTLGLTMLACVAVGMGASMQTAGQRGDIEVDVDDPIVVLWRNGAWDNPSGLLLAAWSDGTVIAADNPDDPESTLRRGMLPGEEIGPVLGALRESELAQLPSARYLVPNASAYKIGLRLGDETKVYQWDEVVHPFYGANIRATEPYIEFAGDWTRFRIRLLGLYRFDHSAAPELGSRDPYFRAARRAARTWTGSEAPPAEEAGEP